MIVWGGDFGFGNFLNTGGRYNPKTDSWMATSLVNVPSERDSHTAVWTGREMIVWGGGAYSDSNTGGRYNPGAVPLSLGKTDAPRGTKACRAIESVNAIRRFARRSAGSNASPRSSSSA